MDARLSHLNNQEEKEIVEVTPKTRIIRFNLKDRMEKDVLISLEASLFKKERRLVLKVTKEGSFIIS